jgi:hypothetical protein
MANADASTADNAVVANSTAEAMAESMDTPFSSASASIRSHQDEPTAPEPDPEDGHVSQFGALSLVGTLIPKPFQRESRPAASLGLAIGFPFMPEHAFQP